MSWTVEKEVDVIVLTVRFLQNGVEVAANANESAKHDFKRGRSGRQAEAPVPRRV